MKKRFLCLMLCVIMALPIMLTGCSNAGAAGDETTSSTSSPSKNAMTLTLYTITEKSTTEEAIQQVQDAINLVTESDFNTHIVLKTTTADKYEKLIAGAVEDIEEQILKEEEEKAAKKAAEKAAREAAKQAAKENGGKATTTKAEETTVETTEADETILNEFGFEETVYPEIEGTQLDIFLIPDFEMFNEYQKEGYLAQLDEQLSIGAKILKQYIHPNFLSATKVAKKTYAIQSNHAIGGYEYLLVNKEVFDGLYYDFDNVTKFNDLADYFNDVMKYESDVIPLLGEYDGGVYYLDGRESLFGAIIPNDLSTPVSCAPVNLINNVDFINYYTIMKNLKDNDAIVTDGSLDDGNTYAAAVIEGDVNTPTVYEEDYYVLTLKAPTATNENMYTGMYAISTFTKDVARAMDIVTYLQTNEEFINLFTYGIEDVHYTRDELTGMVTRLNKDYMMDMNYTGNQFLMWPNDEMDEKTAALAANNWELAKLQNLDMVMHPYLGFVLETKKIDPEDEEKTKMIDIVITDEEETIEFTISEALDMMVELGEEILPQLEDFEPYIKVEEKKKTQLVNGKKVTKMVPVETLVEFKDFVNETKRTLNDDEKIALLINAENAETPAGQYTKWFSAK